MKKAKLKTEESEASINDFIQSVENEQKRGDCHAILEMMRLATGAEPKMWGSSIIGFGNVSLKYESGRELDWFKIGFSPRKQHLVFYGLLSETTPNETLKNLGKHSTGKGCLYINKLEDIDKGVLQKMMDTACNHKNKDDLA